ncbi:unnamed protein product, partial [Owenia fusiformis]
MMSYIGPILLFLFIVLVVCPTETRKQIYMNKPLGRQIEFPDNSADNTLSAYRKKHNVLNLCTYSLKKKKGMVCVCQAKAKTDQIPLGDLLKHMDKKYKSCASLRFENFEFEILKNGSFMGFEHLSSIYLINCSIIKIERNTFKNFVNRSNVRLTIEMNPIEHIEPGTFKVPKSWKQLSLHQNQNLGTENILTVFNDLQNKAVENLEIKTCGVFLRKIDKSFFEPLRYARLRRLNMLGNSFGILEADAFEPLAEFLDTLVLWNFMYVAKDTFEIFYKLRTLDIGGFIVTASYYPLELYLNISGLRSLSINMKSSSVMALDMSGLKNLHELHMTSGSFAFWPHIKQVIGLLNIAKSLQQIDLSENSLCKYSDVELCQIFQDRYSLNFLSLKSNDLSHLPQCIFKGLYNLRDLNLQSNLLTFIERGIFKDLHSLSVLDLSRNAITFIDPSNLEIMKPIGGGLILNLHQNNFDCNCQLKGLRNWLTMNILQNRYKFKYTAVNCSTPTYKQTEYIHNFTMMWIECNTQLVIEVSSISGGLILIITIVTLVLLKHFWKDIQYRKMIILARKHEQDVNLDGLLIEHDAFVSYHSEKRLWVNKDLCNELERGLDIKFKLMYDDRITPGGSLFTSLGNAIHTSRKILFVVSRGWVKDGMNQFEVDMALAKLLDDY